MTFFFFALHLILSSYFDVVVTRTRPSNVVNTRYSASPSNFCRGTSLVTIQQQGDYEGIVRSSSRVATQVYDLNIEDCLG